MVVLYLSENGKGWSLLSFILSDGFIIPDGRESIIWNLPNSLLDIVPKYSNSFVIQLWFYCQLPIAIWSTDQLRFCNMHCFTCNLYSLISIRFYHHSWTIILHQRISKNKNNFVVVVIHSSSCNLVNSILSKANQVI